MTQPNSSDKAFPDSYSFTEHKAQQPAHAGEALKPEDTSFAWPVCWSNWFGILNIPVPVDFPSLLARFEIIPRGGGASGENATVVMSLPSGDVIEVGSDALTE